MGEVGFRKGQLISEISESVGFKSGLSFSYERMLNFVSERSKRILTQNEYSVVGVRAEEYEELYFDVLQGTGYIPNSTSFSECTLFSLFLKNKYDSNSEKFEIGMKIYKLYAEWMIAEIHKLEAGGKIEYGISLPIDSYLKLCYDKYGSKGYALALELLVHNTTRENISPWNNVRRVDWRDKAELEELYKSESLDTYYGTFIDQRYIDYLSNHLDDVGEINWRKFEALTGEFFKRNGYEVALGKGRNDSGIDIRVWREKEDKENPPMILIQCKRQKEKVKREIIKALWADIEYEKAESGLIVTSSHVSLGAKEDCSVRGYNISFAERDKLKEWIKSMRSRSTDIIV